MEKGHRCISGGWASGYGQHEPSSVASLLGRKDMDLEHVVNHRIVEDNREKVHVSPSCCGQYAVRE